MVARARIFLILQPVFAPFGERAYRRVKTLVEHEALTRAYNVVIFGG